MITNSDDNQPHWRFSTRPCFCHSELIDWTWWWIMRSETMCKRIMFNPIRLWRVDSCQSCTKIWITSVRIVLDVALLEKIKASFLAPYPWRNRNIRTEMQIINNFVCKWYCISCAKITATESKLQIRTDTTLVLNNDFWDIFGKTRAQTPSGREIGPRPKNLQSLIQCFTSR